MSPVIRTICEPNSPASSSQMASADGPIIYALSYNPCAIRIKATSSIFSSSTSALTASAHIDGPFWSRNFCRVSLDPWGGWKRGSREATGWTTRDGLARRTEGDRAALYECEMWNCRAVLGIDVAVIVVVVVVAVYEGLGRMEGNGFNAYNWNERRFHVRKELELCDIDILIAIGLGRCCRRTILWEMREVLTAEVGGSSAAEFLYAKLYRRQNIFVQEMSQIQPVNGTHIFFHLYPIVQSKIIYICPPFFQPQVSKFRGFSRDI